MQLSSPTVINFPPAGVAEIVEEDERVHLTPEDLKELWGAGLLNDVAYLALVLFHLRQQMLADGNATNPNSLLLDVDSFINKYGRWEGFTPAGKDATKRLFPRHLLAAMAKLEEKHLWEIDNVPKQLSLSFLGG